VLIRIALTLGLLAAVSCAAAIDTTIADATIVAAVKTALLNEPSIDGTLVTVRSEGGVVFLSGAQPTSEAAAQVVSLVRRVEGVRDVQSSISIVPRSDPPGAGVP